MVAGKVSAVKQCSVLAELQALVYAFVTFEVALVASGVVTARARVVFLAAVDGQVTLQQRLPTEAPSTVGAGVAVVVEYHDVFSQRCLGAETDATTLQLFVARLVHGGDVTFQVVTAICDVPTVGTREQLPAKRVTHQHGQL